jgi:hypothetical protein
MSMMIRYNPRGRKSQWRLCSFSGLLILDSGIFLRISWNDLVRSISLSAHLETSCQVKWRETSCDFTILADVAPRLRCLGCCILGASRRDNCLSTSIICLMKHYRIKGTKALQAFFMRKNCHPCNAIRIQLEAGKFQLQRKRFSINPVFKQ